MESLVADLVAFAEAFFREADDERGSLLGPISILNLDTGESFDLSPPHQLIHVWERYLLISQWRGIDSMTGKIANLTISVIKDWLAVTGDLIGEFELDVLMRLEGAFWDAQAKGQEGQKAHDPLESLKHTAREAGRIRTVAVNPKAKGQSNG